MDCFTDRTPPHHVQNKGFQGMLLLVLCLISGFDLSSCFKVGVSSVRQRALTKLHATVQEKATPDAVSQFCVGTNTFFKSLTIKPVREFAEIIPAKGGMNFLESIFQGVPTAGPPTAPTNGTGNQDCTWSTGG